MRDWISSLWNVFMSFLFVDEIKIFVLVQKVQNYAMNLTLILIHPIPNPAAAPSSFVWDKPL